MNNNSDKIKMKGTIKEILPGGIFSVILENKAVVTCTVSGKMRQFKISILPGDAVDVEISLYDLKKGRIIYRYI